MRLTRHRFLKLTLCAFSLIAALSSSSFAQTLQINAIKANYLEGFMGFVRWDGKLETKQATIGVIGSKEMLNHLQSIADAKTDGRSLEVVEVNPGQEIPELNILFIAAGNRKSWPRLIEDCAAKRILLVGEEDGFAEAGGCIEFTIRKNRLRFNISTVNAETCGIKVSSKLTELALK